MEIRFSIINSFKHEPFFHMMQLKLLENGGTLGELTTVMIRQHCLILETNH